MKLLTRTESHRWCIERGLLISEDGYIRHAAKPLHGLTFPLPTIALKAIGLSIVLSRGLGDSTAERSLLWLKAWDIWSEDYERLGVNLFQGIRRSGEDPGDLQEHLGRLFDPEESLDLNSSLVLPILFQWDAYLIPDHANHLVFICHDGFVNVSAKTEEHLDLLLRDLSYWNPTKAVPGKTNRFKGTWED